MKKNKARKTRKKRHKAKKKTHTPPKPSGYHAVELEHYTVYFDHHDWPFEGSFTYVNKPLIHRVIGVNFLLLFSVLFVAGCVAFGVNDMRGIYFMLAVASVFAGILSLIFPLPQKVFKNLKWSQQAHATIQKGHLKLTLDGELHDIPLHRVKKYEFFRNNHQYRTSFGIYITLVDNTKIKLIQSNQMVDHHLNDMSEVAHVIAAALPPQLQPKDINATLMSQKAVLITYGISAVCVIGTFCIYFFAIRDWMFLLIFLGLSLFYPHFMLSMLRMQSQVNRLKRYVNTQS